MKCINCAHGFHGVNKACKVVVRETYDYADTLCGCRVQPSQAHAVIETLTNSLSVQLRNGKEKAYTFSCDDIAHQVAKKPRRIAKWGRTILIAQNRARKDGWHIDRSGQVQCPDHYKVFRVMGQKVASK